MEGRKGREGGRGNLIYIAKDCDACHADNTLKGGQATEESSNYFIARKARHSRDWEECTARMKDKEAQRKRLNIRMKKRSFEDKIQFQYDRGLM